MSHAASKPQGALTHVMQALALAAVFAALFLTAHLSPTFEGPFGVIAAVGFLLLAGMLASELSDLVGLPHLTAYIMVGVVAGPHVFNLIDDHAVHDLQVVNTLALALIALAGGVELRVSLLTPLLRSLAWATLVQSVVGIVCMSAVFFALARFVPFTRDLDTRGVIGVSILWGVFAIVRAPSALLAIMAQLKPDGPLSRFSLAFIMSSDIVCAVLLSRTTALVRSLVEPMTGFSFADLGTLGHHLIGSITLGTTVGLLLIGYLWLASGQLLLVLVALGYGLTEGLRYLHFDPLLTFLTAGFVVANLSEQGPKLLHAIEQTGSLVFVVFFATAGAHLDLPLLQRLWQVALALSAARIATSYVAHRISSRLANDEPVVRKLGWSSMISQAGLALGMAAIIERAFPTFGSGFRALAIATIAINEIIGPVVYKVALDKSQETGKALPH